MKAKIKKFVLWFLAIVGITFIVMIIAALISPTGPNPQIIENDLKIPDIKIMEPSQEILNENISTFSVFLTNKGVSGEVLVTLRLLDKNERLIKEFNETYHVESGESRKIEFTVETPIETVSYKFKTKAVGVTNYYALIKNEGEEGNVCVIFTLLGNNIQIIKTHNETYYFKSKESKPVNFFIETPVESASYGFATQTGKC